jgi:hypothetical protein
MGKITFGNGVTMTFEGNPSQADIDEMGQVAMKRGGNNTPQGESGDDHTGGMSRVSALDYWIKNPAKAAGKAIMNDVNLVTHPLDTAVGMAKGIAKPFQDVAKDPKGQLKQFGKDMSNPGKLISDAGKSAGDMIMNHPLQTAAMVLPGAEGAVGLAEKGIETWEKLSPEMKSAYKAGKYNSVLKAHTDAYRKILNPGKNILNSTNINVEEASKTLAKEKVIIKTDVNRKLENADAIKQLQEANKPLYKKAQDILESSPDKKFNLKQIGNEAKTNVGKYIKNAEERIAAKKQVDSAIKAEISENGGSSIVDAPAVYRIKQGMYERAFNPLEPTSNNGARAIGRVIKEQVEKSFEGSPIREINKQIGKRLEAQTLLEKTNGNVVQGGKLGQAVGRLVGASAGGAIGTTLGPVGTGTGTLLGQEAGAKVVDFINNPERLTSSMAKKMESIEKDNQ